MTVVTGKCNLRKSFIGGGQFTYTWLSNWIVSYVFILTPWTLFCENFVFHTLQLQCTTCLWSPLFSHRATLWDRLFLQYKEIIKLLRIFRLHRISLQVRDSNLVRFLSVFFFNQSIIGLFYLYLHSFKKQSKDEEVCPRLEGIFCGACQCKECPY